MRRRCRLLATVLYASLYDGVSAPHHVGFRNLKSLSSVVVISVPGLSPFDFAAGGDSKTRDPSEFRVPHELAVADDGGAPAALPATLRLIGGKAPVARPRTLQVPPSNPLHGVAKLFRLAFPLVSGGSANALYHPAYMLTKLPKNLANLLTARLKQLHAAKNKAKSDANGFSFSTSGAPPAPEASGETPAAPQAPEAPPALATLEFPISRMLLTLPQLVSNGYPLHALHEAALPPESPRDGKEIAVDVDAEDDDAAAASASAGANADADADADSRKLPPLPDIVHSNVTSLDVLTSNAEMKLLAVDCEMCLTARGSELTRVSVLDADGNTIFDEYVVPDCPITNYLTQYSGITPAHLENVTTRLQDIQRRLYALVDDHTILIGHSLENDMRALRFTHTKIIDTAVLYMGQRNNSFFKRSLRSLAEHNLKRVIQRRPETDTQVAADAAAVAAPKSPGAPGAAEAAATAQVGHDSVEDALACLDLVKLRLRNLSSQTHGSDELSVTFLDCFRTITPPLHSSWIDLAASCNNYGLKANHAVNVDNDKQATDSAVATLRGEPRQFLWVQLQELNMVLQMPPPENEDEESARKRKLALTRVELDANVRRIHDAAPPESLIILVSPWNCHVSSVTTLRGERGPRTAIEKEGHTLSLEKAVAKAKYGCFMMCIKS